MRTFRPMRRTAPLFAAAGLGAAIAVAGTVPLSAADLIDPAPAGVADPSSAPGWSFFLAPYFWAAGMSGTIATFGAPGVDVDMSFSDIWNSLDFSVMAAGEARHGRFSVTTDLLFLKLSTKQTTPRGVVASNVSLGSTTTEATALAGYSVVDLPRIRLDVLGGARLWSVDNTLSFNGGLLNGRRLDDTATWVDAMGGVKARAELTDRIYLTGWALGGAGGSDFAWDLLGGIGYEVTDRISAVAGYRALGVDYRDGPFEFDVTIQGPIIGASFTF